MLTKLRREEGAAAVEFALIVGVLAMLLFGMLQFGVALLALQNLRSGAREGARVGAVDGTGAQVKARVAAASGISNLGSSLTVYKRTSLSSPPAACPSASCVAVGDADKPCVAPTGPTPVSTVAQIDLSSPSLPTSLQNIFTVDIPLMPSIDLRTINGPTKLYGEFRCES
jgi:Flp pilus assembly protein TadG